jgi:hypothetical protein
MTVGHRRTPNELPPIGTPEHTALLSGSIDLTPAEREASEQALARAGFTWIPGPFTWIPGADVVTAPTTFRIARPPARPDGEACVSGDLTVELPPTQVPTRVTASWVLPDDDAPGGATPPLGVTVTGAALRKVLAPGAGLPAVDRPSTEVAPSPAEVPGPRTPESGLGLPCSGPIGRPLSGAVLRPSDRGRSGRARVLPPPPVVAGPPTGALRMRDVQEALAATGSIPTVPDPTPTGELVRPFVGESGAPEWAAVDSVPPPVSVDVFQRSVRADAKREAPATRTDGATEQSTDDDQASDGPWATSADQVPTRRQLRAKEKAAGSTRTGAVRRIAKGGVLAVTALGVVATATPQGLTVLGAPQDPGQLARSALDFAGAVAPSPQSYPFTPEQVALQQRLSQRWQLRAELGDQAADDAGNAALLAGGTLVDLARTNDAAVQARRDALAARAARSAVRDPKPFAMTLISERGWSQTQFQCLDRLWLRESNWNPFAYNPSSGAYGIAQALPGSKMAAIAADWKTNPITQMKWGINYIVERYQTPCGALSHSDAQGWY